MNRLNMNGLKETEIGLIPENWEVVCIRDYIDKTKHKNPLKEPDKEFNHIDISGVSLI